MTEEYGRVRVEQVDWASTLPWVGLFRSFRIAMHPAKLALSLLLILAVVVSGMILDTFWAGHAYEGEIEAYALMPAETFEEWRQDQEQGVVLRLRSLLRRRLETREDADALANALDFPGSARALRAHYQQEQQRLRDQEGQADPDRLARRLRALDEQMASDVDQVQRLEPDPIFSTVLAVKLAAFKQIVRAATELNFGFRQLMEPHPGRTDSVVGGLWTIGVTLPSWFWHTNPWFGIVLGTIALVASSLLGGAVCRLAALQATRDRRDSAFTAVRFVLARWGWFILAPLMPLLLILGVALAMAVGGAVLLNFPWLQVLGGFFFFLALLGGVVIAVTLIGLAAGGGLLFPAVAVEGSDSFDAVSRAGSYVFGRPWRWLFYNVVALLYGAITYVFLGFVVLLALLVVHLVVGAWVGDQVPGGPEGFDIFMKTPAAGALLPPADLSAVSTSVWITAWLIRLHLIVFIGLLGAYVVSYYFTSQTWIYLLLRRAVDGTELDTVYIEPIDEPSPGQPDPPPTPRTPEQAEPDARGPEGPAAPEGALDEPPLNA